MLDFIYFKHDIKQSGDLNIFGIEVQIIKITSLAVPVHGTWIALLLSGPQSDSDPSPRWPRPPCTSRCVRLSSLWIAGRLPSCEHPQSGRGTTCCALPRRIKFHYYNTKKLEIFVLKRTLKSSHCWSMLRFERALDADWNCGRRWGVFSI